MPEGIADTDIDAVVSRLDLETKLRLIAGRVANAGGRRGKQVGQVYASRRASTFERPARVRSGFRGIDAAPGETVEVEVSVAQRPLRHWDTVAGAWAVGSGTVVVETGPNAGPLPLRAEVTL